MREEPEQTVAAAGDDEVPVDEDLPFQEREWRVQRWGWIVMTVIVVAALLGLTGAGLLASARDRTADDALQIQYARFGRIQTPSEIELQVATAGAEQVALWLANDFLDAVAEEATRPNPIETRAGTERQEFIFAADPTDATIRIRIEYRHDAMGIVSGSLGIVDGPALEFRQFVYP